jgi:hypothetical protein
MKHNSACLFALLFILIPTLGKTQLMSGPTGLREPPFILGEIHYASEGMAEEGMIPHGLQDNLQSPLNRDKTKLQEVFLHEDFSDGNYSQDPSWVVTAGNFQITQDKKLYSLVPVIHPQTSSSSRKAASIQTLVRIGSAFELNLSCISESTGGTMEIVLLGGFKVEPRYRLLYQVSPSHERPIKIVRERSLKQFPSPKKWQHTIESAEQYPALDDGALHLIQWTRDSQGLMRVLVDGVEVLNTVETFYQSDFDGVELINLGGSYKWGPIKIMSFRHSRP